MQQQQQACMLHDCTFALMHVIAIYLPTANVSLIMCSCTLHTCVHGAQTYTAALHADETISITGQAPRPRASTSIDRQLATARAPRSSPPINTLGSHAHHTHQLAVAASFPQLQFGERPRSIASIMASKALLVLALLLAATFLVASANEQAREFIQFHASTVANTNN
jgi:hypothetical protein